MITDRLRTLIILGVLLVIGVVVYQTVYPKAGVFVEKSIKFEVEQGLVAKGR